MADYTVPTDASVAGVAGTGTIAAPPVANTYDLPNFVGELFQLVPTQTPFLSMAGGLTGGKSVPAKEFGWQVQGNEAAAADAQALEGDAPVPSVQVRQEVKNVVEIHQESVALSYTKQAAWGQLGIGGDEATTPPLAGVSVNVLGTQPVMDEMSNQLALKIGKIARDVELSFLTGTYAAGDAIGEARATRGILTAATTHTVGTGALSRAMINTLLAGMYESEDTVAPLIQPVIFVNGTTKTWLSTLYTNNMGLADRSRTIGGVAVDTILTDFGSFGVVLDRYMPTDGLLIADMSVVAPCFLPIPGKGHFFAEPLAKTGAYDHVQLYGEIGLEYGPEQYHAQLTGLTIPV